MTARITEGTERNDATESSFSDLGISVRLVIQKTHSVVVRKSEGLSEDEIAMAESNG